MHGHVFGILFALDNRFQIVESCAQRFQFGAQAFGHVHVESISVLLVQLYELIGEHVFAAKERMMGERDAQDF